MLYSRRAAESSVRDELFTGLAILIAPTCQHSETTFFAVARCGPFCSRTTSVVRLAESFVRHGEECEFGMPIGSDLDVIFGPVEVNHAKSFAVFLGAWWIDHSMDVTPQDPGSEFDHGVA